VHCSCLFSSSLGFVESLENRSAMASIVLKEPRLSLTYPFWRPLVDTNAVCVMIYRHPFLVATGLRTRARNAGMTLPEWLALWEKYQIGTLRACDGLPKVGKFDCNEYSFPTNSTLPRSVCRTTRSRTTPRKRSTSFTTTSLRSVT
jgi:hypothetical protein